MTIPSNGLPPIHPGEILRDELEALGLSANALAKILRVPTNRVTAILNGKRGISASTALRLARFFATSPEFWLNLQAQYDLKLALKQEAAAIARIKPRRTMAA